MAAVCSNVAKFEPFLRLIPLHTTICRRTMLNSCTAFGGNFPERAKRHQLSLGYERGPLTELPDWSFADGTAAPLSGRRRKLRVQQMQYATKIIQLLGEVDFAVERCRLAEEEKRNEKQRMLDEKLKPKGDDDSFVSKL